MIGHDKYLRESEVNRVLLFASIDWLLKLHNNSNGPIKLVYISPTNEAMERARQTANEMVRFLPLANQIFTKMAFTTVAECEKSLTSFTHAEKVVFEKLEEVEPDHFWRVIKSLQNQVDGNALNRSDDNLVNLSFIFHAESFTKIIPEVQEFESTVLFASNNPVVLADLSKLSVALYPTSVHGPKVSILSRMIAQNPKQNELAIIEDPSLANYRDLAKYFTQADGRKDNYHSIIVPRLPRSPKELFQIMNLLNFTPTQSDHNRQLIFVFEPQSGSWFTNVHIYTILIMLTFCSTIQRVRFQN